ncbi:MAG: UDP-N-acetylmuramoyl-L-alanyl-D-glutamate--2,6-diaminopimelate ligase [Planctomycetes bacterium]|nr:UDP-N-acetylmuramoyl-L-alanyl-D-glutamate--2,6-diaminopimelate ligase [Planctomycetota bacterium]
MGSLAESLMGVVEDVVVEGPDALVTGLAIDSRKVTPGDLFIASQGSRHDGLRFVEQALARGASAVLAAARPALPDDVGFVGVPDVALAKAVVADRFFGHPSRRLDVIGVTGTNGKTTSAAMISSMLAMDGRPHGVIGTLGVRLRNTSEPLANTTPDAVELQRLLARMVDDNLSAVVMEVSSHALELHRVHGVAFDVGVFTNLSQDHLDFHQTMDAYGHAKGRLFRELSSDATAVLNADDPWSAIYAEHTPARLLTYALDGPARVHGRISRLDADGTAFRLDDDEAGLQLPIDMRLVGRHNVSNALAAAGAALALGLPAAAITTGLASLAAVPGRLESIDCGQDFRVLVDYAHTPDALEQVLRLLRPLTRGRLHVVFGCGGDRDRSKRPRMGAAVASAADALWVTSDNPRSEDPASILEQILAGVPDGVRERTVSLVDRREAIAAACRAARGGDIVLVAGKGHETTQTVGDSVLPFDDRDVCREVLWTL